MDAQIDMFQSAEATKPPKLDLWSLMLRERYALPDEWEWCELRAIDGGVTLVRGAVAPAITRGKRAGGRDWKRMDKVTERTYAVPTADFHAFELEWEQRTGLCHRCTGRGDVVASASVSGTIYKACPRLQGWRGSPAARGMKMGAWSKCIVRSAASDGRTLEFEWRRMSDVMAGLIAGMSYMPESNAEDTCERVQYMGRLLRRGFELYCHPMPGVALRATALNQPGGTSIGYTAVSSSSSSSRIQRQRRM